MASARLRLIVSGKVQGVGFRAFVAREAGKLGLRGYVRNLADGRVEAEFEGQAASVEAMLFVCRRGPSYARVDSVETVEASGQTLPGLFKVLRDS